MLKGTLCDGHVHVNAHEMNERFVESANFRRKKNLLKIANNEMFSEETRAAIWSVLHTLECENWWRNAYIKYVNHDKPLREDKSETTSTYWEFNTTICATCGQEGLDGSFIYCPGCGKRIDWGGD